MAAGNFKVIIVGGGPVGLIAAHAMRLAGIDFIVLERRDNVVIDVGASIVLGPSSLRVMHQLGLLNKLLLVGSELYHKKAFILDGYEFNNSTPLQYMRQNHGTGPMSFHRAELVNVLYESLPENDRSKVTTEKCVIDIETDENGVKVTCADGTMYDGSIVLGADGVHSKTRRLMRKLALESDHNRKWDPEYPYTSTYRCMWGSFPRPSASGQGFETYHQDRSVMYITGRDRAWIFAYEKLTQVATKPTSYTANDIESFAESFAEFPVNETLKIKDVFPKIATPGMSNLEEGVVKEWSWGRIVLAGDACHKFTPNAGLGFQNGIQDVVALCNELRRRISTNPEGIPNSLELAGLFKCYQSQRTKALEIDASVSAFTTRMHAWANKLYYITSRYLMTTNLWDYIVFNYIVPRAIKKSLVLDYVTTNEPYLGAVSWENAMNIPSEQMAI